MVNTITWVTPTAGISCVTFAAAAKKAGHLFSQHSHAQMQLPVFLPPAPVPSTLTGSKRLAPIHLPAACDSRSILLDRGLPANVVAPSAPSEPTNLSPGFNNALGGHRNHAHPKILTHQPITMSRGPRFPRSNSANSFTSLIATRQIMVFANANATQLSQKSHLPLAWRIKWDKVYAVYFILSFAESPFRDTKMAIRRFIDSPTALAPPTAQQQRAPELSLTSALATLGLVACLSPTIKFLCFPVTNSIDGDPHYLFGAYIPAAHLFFPTIDMLKGYCGWSIGTRVAYVYCFDFDSTPISINDSLILPDGHCPKSHPA
eukprot:jgi/Psemu1/43998/gm1.43998_g